MKSNKIQHPKKRALLAAYAECGNVSQAARIAECDRTMHYDWMRDDADYAVAFAHAEGEAGDALERKARELAIDGWNEPVYQGGMKVGTKRKYSATLLIFLLKGARPEKYRDRVEHSGPNGGPMEHRVQSITQALQEVRDDPHYAEVRRAAVLGHSSQPGAHGLNGKSGPMANGEASRNGRSGHS